MGFDESRLRARAREQERYIVGTSQPVEQLLFRPGRLDDARAVDLDESAWTTAAPGLRWGGDVPWAWFRAWFRVSRGWEGERVRLFLPLGGQGMVYIDGVPFQGLDEYHRTITLPTRLCDGERHIAAIECYAAGAITAVRRPEEAFSLGECAVQRVDIASEAYYYDLLVGVEALDAIPASAPERAPLLDLLLTVENSVDRRQPSAASFRASVAEAHARLQDGLARLALTSAPGRPRVRAVGHAHIDTAWMWTLDQTRRKIVRSWSTALRLMERYPDYHFICSQPQQYVWLEEDEPDLYPQIMARIAEGRWEPAGAMWVEPDTNVPSGESLVRQLLYGQRYSVERFGRPCSFLWLPDVFGYSGALPQLLRSAGVHTFVTTKLSWNADNRMPHDTFWWHGIDGTEVLTYFITGGSDWRPEDLVRDPGNAMRDAATYNGDLSIRQIVGSWVRYRDKGLNSETLYSYGYGDGGGGPTEKMLEYATRLRDYPGLPTVVQGGAEQFFADLRERLLGNPRTPSWVGELYFEYHRGTYTSQARVKWDNRRAEEILHDAELWCAWAEAQGAGDPAWHEVLHRCWELVLLNQFHDILPGSSIGEVYADQRRQHAEVQARASTVLAVAQSVVARTIQAPALSVAVFNASPFPRRETMRIDLPPSAQPGTLLLDAGGHALLTQWIEDAENAVLVAGLTVPPLGYTVVTLAQTLVTAPESPLAATERVLENRFFRLELDAQGNFASLYDKRWKREVLAGPGNRLVAFEDKPLSYDAWDIDRFYTEKSYPIDEVRSLRVVEHGPVRAGIEIVRHWGPSTIRQRIFLHAETPRIDIQTHIDWHHRQVLLKAAFPLAVHAMQATYECAFGHVQRPTHRNTSWDEARFEVPAHRWADLSEAGYGVSLLNDGKYGYDCLGNVLRLTLLKSGIQPDPLADEGEHHFAYALLSHGPDWSIEDTVQAGYNFNLPVHSRLVGGGSGSGPIQQSFVVSDHENAVIDTVKLAEDGDGIILRVYDCANRRGPVRLTFTMPPVSVGAVTILEQPDPEAGPISLAGDTLAFDLLPFQVRSFRVRL